MKPIKNKDENIRTYLNMALKGKPAVDDFNTSFSLLHKIYEYAPENFLHDYPFDVIWEVTAGCNLRCKHCYIQNRDGGYVTKDNLSSDSVLGLAENLAEFFEVCHVTLTGGEPFLHPDIMDIIRVLKSYNISLYIQTNATLFSTEIIEELSELLNPNIDVIQVSLDGLSNKHDEIRGKKIHEIVLSNIKELINKGIFVSVNCTMTKINQPEILDLFLMCNNIGVKRFTLTKLVTETDEQKSFELCDDEVFEIIANIIRTKYTQNLDIIINPLCFRFVDLVNNTDVRKILDEEFSEFLNQSSNKECLNCHSREKISIKPDGKIYLCPEVISPNALIGDLKVNTLSEIWENVDKHPLFQSRKIEKMVCRKCKYLLNCQAGCMGENFVQTNNIHSKSPRCKIKF